MAPGYRLGVENIGLKFPRTSRVSQVSRAGDAGNRRIPAEQWPLIRLRHGMFREPLLSPDGPGAKKNSIVGDESHKRLACSLVFGQFGKGSLGVDHRLQGRLILLSFCKRERNKPEQQRQANDLFHISFPVAISSSALRIAAPAAPLIVL